MDIDVVNIELKREYSVQAPNRIATCEDAYKFICQQIGHATVEKFILICIDYDYRPLCFSTIGIGSSDKIIIELSEIFKTALLVNAKHLIVAHNHIGSSLEPTQSDLDTTKNIGYIGRIMGIELIDSLIVNATDEYLSIRRYIAKKEKQHEVG